MISLLTARRGTEPNGQPQGVSGFAQLSFAAMEAMAPTSQKGGCHAGCSHAFRIAMCHACKCRVRIAWRLSRTTSCFVDPLAISPQPSAEKEPNAGEALSKLSQRKNRMQAHRDQTHLRVDIVCERSDGSAVRLHPSKNGKDAATTVGFLQKWRVGIRDESGGGVQPRGRPVGWR